MCVMCACINRKREAAPDLMAMGKRIEGLWSGYYTGIGCLGDDQVIRSCKTTGWSKYWEQQFSLKDVPGRMGFFHSRTGSGGDSRYAHPFLSRDGNCLLISQGCAGIFAGRHENVVKTANMLFDRGVRFGSADFNPQTRKYLRLADGSQIHISDVACEYAAFLNGQGGDPLETVRKTGTDIPEESVSLFIFKDHPGHIYIANMNQRMFIVFDEDSVKLATCALAMGDRRLCGIELPGNTAADVTPDGIRMERMSDRLHPYLPVPANLEKAFLEWVKANPKTLLAHTMDNALKTHYPEGVLRHVPVFEIFEKLYYDGVLALETEEDRPGMDEMHKSILNWIVPGSLK